MSAVSFMKYSESNELYLHETSVVPRLLYHSHSVLQQQTVFSACVNKRIPHEKYSYSGNSITITQPACYHCSQQLVLSSQNLLT
jgi:hypothetical protein